jgi:hypothetical protein
MGLDRDGAPAGMAAGIVPELLGPLNSGMDSDLFAYGT